MIVLSTLKLGSRSLVSYLGLLTLIAVVPAPASAESGLASFYGNESGSQTASGQRFNEHASTCAHKSYPFGTTLRVTDQATGRSVVCTVNDRGPFVRGRIIDLTTQLARELGITKRGVAMVTVEKIS